jgi:hypothetical protein
MAGSCFLRERVDLLLRQLGSVHGSVAGTQDCKRIPIVAG